MTSSTDPTDLGVADAVAAIRAGRTTAGELLEACLARIAATDGAIGAWTTVDGDAARTEARAPRRRARERPRDRAAPRRPGRDQGHHRRRRYAYDRWRAAVRPHPPRPRRDPRRTAPGRGGRHRRQDRRDAVRLSRPGRHAQPVGPRPHARRLLVGIGGRRRGSSRAGRNRDTDDRVDPAARGVLRGRRAEGRLRRRAARRRPAARRVPRPRRAARPVRRRRGARGGRPDGSPDHDGPRATAAARGPAGAS